MPKVESASVSLYKLPEKIPIQQQQQWEETSCESLKHKADPASVFGTCPHQPPRDSRLAGDVNFKFVQNSAAGAPTSNFGQLEN